jgi:hypothetical protein
VARLETPNGRNNIDYGEWKEMDEYFSLEALQPVDLLCIAH